MKFLSLLLILFPTLAFASGYSAKERYSVEFTELSGSCTGKETTSTFTRHFGDRNKAGGCLDNPELYCSSRYTMSLAKGMRFGSIAAASPAICSGGAGQSCTEVQFMFERSDKTNADMLSLHTFRFQGKKDASAAPILIKVESILNQTKKYVIALDACSFSIMNFKVTQRP